MIWWAYLSRVRNCAKMFGLDHFAKDGSMVRFVSALLAPVVPLAVMLCCMLLEFRRPGAGISAGLQAKWFCLRERNVKKWQELLQSPKMSKDFQSLLVAGGNWLFETEYVLFEYSLFITRKGEQPKRENGIVCTYSCIWAAYSLDHTKLPKLPRHPQWSSMIHQCTQMIFLQYGVPQVLSPSWRILMVDL